MIVTIIIILTIILILTFIKIFPDKENGEKTNKLNVALGVVGTIAVIAVLFSSIEHKDKWKEQDNSEDAFYMAQQFVKEKLKSPSTAEFPYYYNHKDHIHYNGNQSYSIKSFVDSQNSFGAIVRSNFIADIKQTSKDKWQLTFINFY